MLTGPVVVSVFTEDQAEKLTGISKRQLRLWDRSRFFVPSHAYEDRRSPYSRLYSFRDLASLRVINALRNDANVTLSHLWEVKDKLAHMGDDLWSRTVLYVLNRKVIFNNPDNAAREEIVSGQAILEIPLKVVSGNLQEAVNTFRTRDAGLVGKVERRRNVAHNQLVIAGTRIPVKAIKAFSDAGFTVDQIKAEYPTLREEDIQAAMAHEKAA